MFRTPEKSLSDSNLCQNTGTDTTPTNFVNTRIKRKRSEEMITDLSDFKNEIKEMLSSCMAQQSNERALITSSLKTIEDSIKFLSCQYEDMKKKVEEMECERRKDKEYIHILENKLENVLKCQRKYSFELKNVPKSDDDSKPSMIKMVTHLSSVLKVDLKPSDIRDIYRASSKGEKKPIVVEVSSYILKSSLLSAAKKYNNHNKSNKLNTYHLGLKCNNIPIFVSEHLTPNGNRLYYLAREMSKAMKYKFCWTSLGDVLVRKDENSPIIKLLNESQIQSMYQAVK